MASMHSHDLFAKLKEVLGLPDHCRSLEIRMAVDELVIIRCECLLEIAEGKPGPFVLNDEGKLITVFADYTISKKDQP